MSLFSNIRAYAKQRRERRRYQETERQVKMLPLEIQKDIGWPNSASRIGCHDDTQPGRRR